MEVGFDLIEGGTHLTFFSDSPVLHLHQVRVSEVVPFLDACDLVGELYLAICGFFFHKDEIISSVVLEDLEWSKYCIVILFEKLVCLLDSGDSVYIELIRTHFEFFTVCLIYFLLIFLYFNSQGSTFSNDF